MLRWPLLLIAFGACGDQYLVAPDGGSVDGASSDAPVTSDAQVTSDATVEPDALSPPACTADTAVDEANCGSCGNQCAGGEVCQSSACSCPSGVVPPIVFPTGTEQFFNAGIFHIALAPTLGLSGLGGLLFGFSTSLPLNTNINLANVPLGSTPFVGAAVGLDIATLSLDASYVATAGTIRFTKICETEIQGTLTNATFSGLSGGLFGGLPTVDPNGCTVSVPLAIFHLRTAPCP